MVAKSDRSERIKDAIFEVVDDARSSDINHVSTRECTSDQFNGVQVNVYGPVVPIRPIIDLVAETDAIAIESLNHVTDAEEPHLGMFIAYLPEQQHPAFV